MSRAEPDPLDDLLGRAADGCADQPVRAWLLALLRKGEAASTDQPDADTQPA
jgi:hypothetical protein